MSEHLDRDEAGPSWRMLVLLFFAFVALCGVVFSLGYLVGYNERPSENSIATEAIPAPAPSASASSFPAEAASAEEPAPSAPPAAATPASGPALSPAAAASSSPLEPTRERAARKTHAPLKPEIPSEEVFAPKRSAAGSIFVQVMASRTDADATRLARMLRGQGYPASALTPAEAHASDNLFRVEVGPYASRDAALAIRDKLSKEGFRPFIRP